MRQRERHASDHGSQVRDVLRIANVQTLVVSSAILMLGAGLAPIALSFATLSLTHSARYLGIFFASRSVPMVVLFPIAGVAGDRYSRKAVMVSSNFLSATTQAVFCIVYFLDIKSIVVLVALGAIGGASFAFYAPASLGVSRDIVSTNLLTRTNAVLRFARSIALILGGSLGGLLVAATNPGWG